MYSEETIEASKKALENLLLDEKEGLRVLDNWVESVNLFDVLKVADREIRHSNFLAWLLNPNENHGLGSAFTEAFITRVIKSARDARIITSLNTIDAWTLKTRFDAFKVFRELDNMDLVLLLKEDKATKRKAPQRVERVVIVENKVWSDENHTNETNQLEEYKKKVRAKYPNKTRKLFVYLTPSGDESQFDKEWIPLSYRDIIDTLENTINKKELKDEVRIIINNYIDIVKRRIIMADGNEEQKKLEELCLNIYKRHGRALRLIYNTINIDPTGYSEIFNSVLDDYKFDEKDNPEGLISDYIENKWEFYTKRMDDYFNKLDDRRVYKYWVERMPSRDENQNDLLRIRLELVGTSDFTTELKDQQDRLTERIKKVTSNSHMQYKTRLYRNDIEISNNVGDYDQAFREAVESLIKQALVEEGKWLEDL